MRIRKIAVLIDGGFFLKRLPRVVDPKCCSTAEEVADLARVLCKRHVQSLIHEKEGAKQSQWLDHVYRLFYYDAHPFSEIAHHPILNQQIQFAKTPEAQFRNSLFTALRRKRKFALRLGHVNKMDGWHLRDANLTKKLLKTRDWVDDIAAALDSNAPLALDEARAGKLRLLLDAWKAVSPDDVRLGLRQKGVDMRIGIDIATLTLKKQVDTIVLVTGDSDFVPAAKVARRKSVEFLLDPLFQSVSDDLNEHVDGIVSGFKRTPKKGQKAKSQSPPATGANEE